MSDTTDLNLVVLCGRLAAPWEIREFESQSRLLRLLITVRSEQPRRVDVIPVTLWDPPQGLIDANPPPGTPLWVAGSVQRRFWQNTPDNRRGRIEVMADQVCVKEEVTR